MQVLIILLYIVGNMQNMQNNMQNMQNMWTRFQYAEYAPPSLLMYMISYSGKVPDEPHNEQPAPGRPAAFSAPNKTLELNGGRQPD